MPSFLCTEDSELFFFGCVPAALHPLYSLASHAAFPEGSGAQGLVIRDRLVSEGPQLGAAVCAAFCCVTAPWTSQALRPETGWAGV